MKYILLIYGDEQAWETEGRDACFEESLRLTQRLREEGKFITASPLHPTTTATSVRLREGRRLVTDGPFAETREQLGGFYMIDAKDLDDAIQIASQIPGARTGTVEIRPVWELAGLQNA